MSLRPALTSAGAAVLGCLLLAPAALAAGGESTPLHLAGSDPAKTASGPSASGGMVRTIVGLVIVLGVIYGLYWVLKQVRSSREERASGQGLAPVASLPLGSNRSLQLVRAGREVVLVGFGDLGLTPIRTFGEDEARALGLLAEDRLLPGDEPIATVPSGGFIARTLDEMRRRTVIR
jgi:flagellar protein FliO/FliZ